MDGLKHLSDCPFYLAEGKLADVVVDNHDFKSDTQRGASQSHLMIALFLQPKLFDPPRKNNKD